MVKEVLSKNLTIYRKDETNVYKYRKKSIFPCSLSKKSTFKFSWNKIII